MLLFFRSCLAALLVLGLSSGASAAMPTLTVYTYDSFTSDWGPGPQVKKAFEARCGCQLDLVGLEDGVSMLNRIKLEGDNTRADLVLGIDVHFEMVPTPAPVPTPIPNPFTGIIFDPLGLGAGQGLLIQQQGALGVAIAQPREAVDDETQPFPAGEFPRPACRFVAVHVGNKLHQPVTAQHGFDFMGTGLRLLQVPLRWQAGVDHREALLLIHRHHWTMTKPVDDLIAVRCVEDFVDVALLG